MAASTAVSLLLFPLVDLSNLIMVYLLGILVISSRQGLGPSTFASFLSVLALDFFFVPPRFSFAVSDTQYLFVFFVMLLVGLAISNLTVRVRQQANVSRLRETPHRGPLCLVPGTGQYMGNGRTPADRRETHRRGLRELGGGLPSGW